MVCNGLQLVPGLADNRLYKKARQKIWGLWSDLPEKFSIWSARIVRIALIYQRGE